jgi:DNA helicase-2/ATP-dependent DNA helicase PcrA
VYDIETTGLDVAVDEIIQIAGVKMDADGNILSKFNQMVVPSREISDGALATHGFDKKYILEHGGVSARCALINFSEFVRGSVIAGHNNLAFDRAIVDRQLAEENLPPLDVLGEYDTLVLSKLLYPSSINYKLETMCKLFGVSNLRAHDAFFDVTATAKVLSCLVKRNIIPSTDVRKKALKKFANRFAPFYKHYKNMSDLLNENKIYELNDYITKNFDIFSRHSEDEDRTACTEIMQIFGCYCAKGDSVKVCIKNFLCDTALSGSQMDILIKRLKKIPIITVHQAKGCEFKTVIIAGADNNNFPSYSAVQSGNGAEEVRVFYVAISRAKQKLILTCYKNARSSYGNTYEKFFSPYIKHIPQQYVEYFL